MLPTAATVNLQKIEKLKLLYVATVACCFHGATLTSATAAGIIRANDISSNDINPSKSLVDDNLQIDNDLQPKRAWNSNLNMWGKRGWNNLHPGWGKRDPGFMYVDEDYQIFPGGVASAADKRAWQNLQGGWGKRFVPSEEDLAFKQIQAALEDNGQRSDSDDLELFVPIEGELDEHHYDKRNWNKFSDGWGKRSEQNKWNKFRGSWGKREPAWNNLKGLWGKRSISE